jgi:N-methylhydantoinase B
MAQERRTIELFDRGGTIEELRARCKEETFLEPPKPPVFAKWMKKSGAFA